MKKIYLVLIAILAISCTSEKSQPNTVDLLSIEADANKFIDSQWSFFEESSLEKAKNIFYEKGVLIGTDKAEFYKNWAELEPSIKAQLAIPNPKFQSRDRTTFVSEDGNMVAFSEILDLSFQMDEQTMTINDMRSTGVIQKMNGEWKIIQMHNSIGVDGQAVEY
ncbi:MAG: nuclear transport factor 2 family protein [Patiriisocius sp.]